MAEDKFSDGVIVGLLVGILVGMPLGWILAQAIFKPAPAPSPSSVVFGRDEAGRVTGIHHVPQMGGGEASYRYGPAQKS